MHPHFHKHMHRDMHFAPRGRRGGGFGPFGGFGRGGFGDDIRIGRMLGSGDLRLLVLLLLSEEPRHGYDLIKAIEEMSSEIYSPSPGVIYPALTYLEEAGHVESRAEGNKKTYQTTDAGELYLSENREEADAIREGLTEFGKKAAFARDRLREHEARRDERRQGPDRDIPGALPELNAARKKLKRAIADAVNGDEEAQRRAADILSRAADDIARGDIDI